MIRSKDSETSRRHLRRLKPPMKPARFTTKLGSFKDNENRPMISLDKDICTDLAQATSREWLETNGTGGFASATLCGSNRRRYHALLTAATKPPVGRMVLLSKFEETIVVGEQRFELSTNEYS